MENYDEMHTEKDNDYVDDEQDQQSERDSNEGSDKL